MYILNIVPARELDRGAGFISTVWREGQGSLSYRKGETAEGVGIRKPVPGTAQNMRRTVTFVERYHCTAIVCIRIRWNRVRRFYTMDAPVTSVVHGFLLYKERMRK